MQPGITVLPPSSPAPPSRSGASRVLLLVAIAVLSGAVTAALVVGLAGRRSPSSPVVVDPALGAPPPGQGEQAAPLGVPEPLARRSGSYSFLNLREDGQPVAFDPCRAIPWVVRPDGAPPGGQEALQWAFDRLSRATGLVFTFEGTTEEAPSPRRQAYQPSRYGYRWAPVLVAWSWPPETADLTGPAAGMAGPLMVESAAADGKVAVSGQAVLDSPQLSALALDPQGRPLLRAVVLHELAHVMGLDHVDDPTQLMNPTTSPGVTDLAAGDLTGLDVLGRGPCAPDL